MKSHIVFEGETLGRSEDGKYLLLISKDGALFDLFEDKVDEMDRNTGSRQWSLQTVSEEIYEAYKKYASTRREAFLALANRLYRSR